MKYQQETEHCLSCIGRSVPANYYSIFITDIEDTKQDPADLKDEKLVKEADLS